ncbi:MAG: hypothetical protein R3242_00035 [Akkermansiaceae bacterium]|nr:hypothetical protein [Akkermansiaceae bacterium]
MFITSVATLGAQTLSLKSEDLPKPGEDGIYHSREGVIDLRWTTKHNGPFLLQATQPSSPDTFERRYEGMDQSSVVTGLAEGTHRFRVRIQDVDGEPGPWSEVLVAEVKYMPRSQIRLLLILGGLVVLITVSAIAHGHLSHKHRNLDA